MDDTDKLKYLYPELGDVPVCLEVARIFLARLPSRAGEPERYVAGLHAVGASERETAAEIATATLWTGVSTAFSVQGDLLSQVGLHHHRLGDLQGAQILFERALAVDQAALGPEHPSVARDWNHFGLLRRDRFDLPAAQEAFRNALAIAEAMHGGEHPYVARYVNNLGTVLLDMGDAVGALAAFQRAFRIDTEVFGHDHVNVAVRASNLGNVLRLFDDFSEARGAYACAHDIFLRRLGPDHPNTRTVAANLLALGDHG
jgi:tetratricopeptide (TPR) repeat protein